MNPLTFQHFEVLSKPDGSPHVLGKGAMGITYKAFDRNLHSLAVIKVITPQFVTDPTARQRFLMEAQAMAKVKHPNVPDVFFLGECEHGVFYAMEFCDGPTIQEYLKNHAPLESKAALTLVRQIAGALQAVEALQLIHRDIKPANIILVKDVNARTQAKLIDFGLSRTLRDADEADPNLSKGGFVGTPSFASPEQLLQQQDLDIRSDIYSLGVTLWFMLTGRPPFVGSQFEVMVQHVRQAPPWDQLPPVPEPTLRLLKKMLEKDRSLRHASASDLYRETQDALEALKKGPGDVQREVKLDIHAKRAGGSLLANSQFEILEDAGEISIGRVFRARDTLTQQIVSLVCLRPALALAKPIVDELSKQAASARSVRHPHLVRLYDFIVDEGGVKLVREWMDGPTLKVLLQARNGKMPFHEAAPLLAQVAEALDTAWIHRLHGVRALTEDLIVLPPDGQWTVAQSRFLRSPLQEWGGYTIKVPSIGLPATEADPDATAVSSPAPPNPVQLKHRFFQEFISLLKEIIGAKDNQFIPLSPASQKLLLESIRPGDVLPFDSCVDLIREIANHEKVKLPEISAASASHANFGPITPHPSQVPQSSQAHSLTGASITLPSQVGASSSTGTSASQSAHPSNAASSQGSAGGAVSERRLELERRRMELQLEEERLRLQEDFEARQNLLEQQRILLEQEKEEIRRAEQERSLKAEEERKKLELDRAALNSREREVDLKRREQEVLERELEERARRELKDLEIERQKLEASWKEREAQLANTLKQKEQEFQLKEQEQQNLLIQERRRLELATAEIENRRKEMAARLEAANQQESELSDQKRELQKRQEALDLKIQEQEQAFSQAREEIEKATRELEARKQALEKEREHLSEQELQRKARFESEIEAQRLQLNAEIEAFAQQRAAAERELQEKQADAEQALVKRQEELQAALQSLDSDRQQLTQKLEQETRQKEAELEKEKSRLEQLKEEFESQQRTKQEELERLEHQLKETLAAREESLRRTANDQNSTAQDLEAARAEVEKAKAELIQSQVHTEEWKQEQEKQAHLLLENAKRGIQEREAALDLQVQEAAKAQKEWEARQSELQDLRAELDRQRESLEDEREKLRESFEQDRRATQEALDQKTQQLEAKINSQKQEEEARERAFQEKQAALQAQIDAEWKKLEEARLNVQDQHRTDEESNAQSLELQKAELAKLHQDLEAKAQAQSLETQRMRDHLEAELERERQALLARESELKAQHQAFQEELERERQAFYLAEEERRKKEAEAHQALLEERTREFAKLENEASSRLEKLREEIQRQEAFLTSQREEVAQQERLHQALNREADANDLVANLKLDEQQRALEEERRLIEQKIEELRAGQKKRLWSIAAGIVIATTSAVVGGYYIKGRLEALPDDLQQRWEKLEVERNRTRSEQDWISLLKWSVDTEQVFLNDDRPAAESFWQNARPKTLEDAQTSIDALLSQEQSHPGSIAQLPAAQKELLARLLDSVLEWPLTSNRLILRAKVKMPLLSVVGDASNSLEAYSKAIAENPEVIDILKPELTALVETLLPPAIEGKVPLMGDKAPALIRALPQKARESAPRIALLEALWKIGLARAEDNPVSGFQIALDTAQIDPSWKKELLPSVDALIASLKTKSAEQLEPVKELLPRISETWEIAEPLLILARSLPEDAEHAQSRFDLFRQANELGSQEARAHVGNFYLHYGVQNDAPEHVQRGLDDLQAAAQANIPQAWEFLATSHLAGLGVQTDYLKAAEEAQKAIEGGISRAWLIKGQALLFHAQEEAKTEESFDAAADALREAVRYRLEGSHIALFQTLWNGERAEKLKSKAESSPSEESETAKNAIAHIAEESAAVLQEGAQFGDANCLANLGLWYALGNPPLEQNMESARRHLADAAWLGNRQAREWCKQYASRALDSGTQSDKAWVQKNQQKWEGQPIARTEWLKQQPAQ